MKTSLNLRSFLLLSILGVLLFSSCESLFDEVFDKNADYRYEVYNSTGAAVEIIVRAKSNPNAAVYGDGKFYYTIAPGEAKQVWHTSGLTGGAVFDEEKGNSELYWFEIISVVKGGQASPVNFSVPAAWQYKKVKNYEAIYTLTLRDNDF